MYYPSIFIHPIKKFIHFYFLSMKNSQFASVTDEIAVQ
nr:MAG TPA: hypothetical protein [Bacteriophage sp.]DAZ75737.1 MAG TPA: hypothetical protein [Caudoviricetes sp.]